MEIEFDRNFTAKHGYNIGVATILKAKNTAVYKSFASIDEEVNFSAILDGICADAWTIYYNTKNKLASSYVISENPLFRESRLLNIHMSFVWHRELEDVKKLEKEIIDILNANDYLITYFCHSKTYIDWILLYSYSNGFVKAIGYLGLMKLPLDKIIQCLTSTSWYTLNSYPITASAYFYGFKVLSKPVSVEEILIESIENAVKLLSNKSLKFGNLWYYASFSAYDAIVKDLSQEKNFEKMNVNELVDFVSWNGFPFLLFQRSRYSAYCFCDFASKFFDGKERKNLEQAKNLYFSIVKNLKIYQDTLSYSGEYINYDKINYKELITKILNPERREKGILLLKEIKMYELEVLDYLERVI